jgi:hypothetical protein
VSDAGTNCHLAPTARQRADQGTGNKLPAARTGRRHDHPAATVGQNRVLVRLVQAHVKPRPKRAEFKRKTPAQPTDAEKPEAIVPRASISACRTSLLALAAREEGDTQAQADDGDRFGNDRLGGRFEAVEPDVGSAAVRALA